MSDRLKGKIALITGTAGGQGRAAAIRFAAEGARVVGCDKNEAGDKETAEMVRAAGGEMATMAVDLTEEDEARGWIEWAVGEFGDFDILYNNASSARFGTIEALTREDWDYTLTNELTLIFLTVKAALPVFRRRGSGAVINVASMTGLVGAGGLAGNSAGALVHAVTKAGVIQMSNVMAVELSTMNVRVNCISPGVILTPGTAPVLAAEDSPLRAAYVQAQLVQRLGTSEDIASAAVYLASDEAAFVTGANLVVDGGYTVGGGVGRPAGGEVSNMPTDYKFN